MKPGLLAPADIVGGGHSLAPRYLAHQIDRSRANLGVETIDVYYLHNPESQLATRRPRDEVMARIGRAFVALEDAPSSAGKIGCYGVATWNGFRVAPRRPRVPRARRAGGARRARDRPRPPLPRRAAALQPGDDRGRDRAPSAGRRPARIARRGGRSLRPHGGREREPAAGQARRSAARTSWRAPSTGCRTDPQRALQFVRSTPGHHDRARRHADARARRGEPRPRPPAARERRRLPAALHRREPDVRTSLDRRDDIARARGDDGARL